jgi:hypothetical protein
MTETPTFTRNDVNALKFETDSLLNPEEHQECKQVGQLQGKSATVYGGYLDVLTNRMAPQRF